MNKKFSTLLAGVALFGATSAFAGNNVPSLIEGTNDGLYQLKTRGNLYLAVNPKGELVTVDRENWLQLIMLQQITLQAHCGAQLLLLKIKEKLLFMTS